MERFPASNIENSIRDWKEVAPERLRNPADIAAISVSLIVICVARAGGCCNSKTMNDETRTL